MRNQPHTSVGKNSWIGNIQSLFASSWATVIFTGFVTLFLVVTFIGFTIFLAYGFSNIPPESLHIPTVPTSATIYWHENKLTSIDSDNVEGAIMALGASHASSYPWQMYLWRQTATGSLTEWFGPNVLHIDRFMKRLRLSSLAKETYHNLPDEQVRLLNAYAAGVNAALHDTKQLRQNELTLLNVTPAPWQPWHTLTIERLFAWLSLDINHLTTDSLGMPLPDWHAIRDADLAVKQWLQLHGFQHSIAGTWPADTLSSRTTLHRFVYGSSAIPLFQEILFKLENQPDTYVATIPGTLMFPSGQSAVSSWFILPSSSAQLKLTPPSLEVITTHERLKSPDGDEVLLSIPSYPGWLLPDEHQNPLDSLPGLSWKGFEPGTDIPAYLSLLSGKESPAFSLFDGNGLITRDSTWSLLGNPMYVYQLKQGVLVGNNAWSSYQASRLNHLLEEPTQAHPEQWAEDCHNDWAEEHATFLLQEYLLRRISFEEEYTDALTYLRNWDFSYSPSSIGAIIFDSWLQNLPDTLYLKIIQKELPPSDTLARTYLQQSITSLKDTFGKDLSKWRLDITKPIHRNYPAWNADSLFTPRKFNVSHTLYAPLTFPGRGHASTLCWGSFLSDDQLDVSARWDAWTTTNENQFAYNWRKQDASDSFLGKYLISNSPSTTSSSRIMQSIIATTTINGGR